MRRPSEEHSRRAQPGPDRDHLDTLATMFEEAGTHAVPLRDPSPDDEPPDAVYVAARPTDS